MKINYEHTLNTGHLDAMLRTLVIAKMGRNGDEAIIAEAKKRFEAHCAGTTTIPADLRGPVSATSLSVNSNIK